MSGDLSSFPEIAPKRVQFHYIRIVQEFEQSDALCVDPKEVEVDWYDPADEEIMSFKTSAEEGYELNHYRGLAPDQDLKRMRQLSTLKVEPRLDFSDPPPRVYKARPTKTISEPPGQVEQEKETGLHNWTLAASRPTLTEEDKTGVIQCLLDFGCKAGSALSLLEKRMGVDDSLRLRLNNKLYEAQAMAEAVLDFLS